MKSKLPNPFSRQRGCMTHSNTALMSRHLKQMRDKTKCKLCCHESCMHTVFANLRVNHNEIHIYLF